MDSYCPPYCEYWGNCDFPNPSDCSSFVRCKNDTAWKKKCPNGQKFNPKTNRCDHPENCDCSYKPPKTTTTTPGPCDYICPPKDMKTGCKMATDCKYPYPGDPSKYIECVPNPDGTGTPFVKCCTGGKLYNRRDKKCDTPYKCECNHTATTPPPSATTTTTCPPMTTTTPTTTKTCPTTTTTTPTTTTTTPITTTTTPTTTTTTPTTTTTTTLTPCTGLSGYVTCQNLNNCSDPTQIFYTNSSIACFGGFICPPITSTTGCVTCSRTDCSDPAEIFYTDSNFDCYVDAKCSNA